MDVLHDISNAALVLQATTKTFERRRRGPKSRNSKDPPQTPASTTPLSSCSSQSDESSCCSTGRSNDQLPASSTCRSSALHRGRRSSVLRAAALPGHQLCREPPASRSLLLQKMPKARQRAFLAYTQQMAKYYAEVDEFELVEETPGAGTEQKARARTRSHSQAAPGTMPDMPAAALPFSHQPMPASIQAEGCPGAATSQREAQRLSPSSASDLSSKSPQPLDSLVKSRTSFLAAAAEEDEEAGEGDDGGEEAWVADDQASGLEAAAEPATQVVDANCIGDAEQEHSSRSLVATPGTVSPAAPAAVPVPAQQQQQWHLPAASSPKSPQVVMEQHTAQHLAACTPAGHATSSCCHLPETPAEPLMPGFLAPHLRDTPAAGHLPDLCASPLLGSSGAIAVGDEAEQVAAQLRQLAVDDGTASSKSTGQLKAIQQQQQQQEGYQAQEAPQQHIQQLQEHLQQLDLTAATPQQVQQQAANKAVRKKSAKLQPQDTQPVPQRMPSARQQERKQNQQQQQQQQQEEEEGLQQESTSTKQGPHRKQSARQQQRRHQEQEQDQLYHQQAVEQPAIQTMQASARQQGRAKQQQEHEGQQEQQLLLQPVQQCQAQQYDVLLEQQVEPQLQQLNDEQLQQLIQQLSLDAAQQLAEMEAAAAARASLTPLQRMLQTCGQSVQLCDIPSMDDFIASVTDAKEVVKLGEGTYGEAFLSGQVVFKLVPMEGGNLINGWPQKGAADLLAEAVIASTLSSLGEVADAAGNLFSSHTQAFVKTHRVGVCRGPYPQSFIKAWKAWDKKNKSENDPIAGLPHHQLYAVFAMANCGKDLEVYQLQGFDQARSMMLQVALALAVAEDSLAFEHRDLHWGNIMLTPAGPDSCITARLHGCSVRVHTAGAVVCLIDFTASRLQTPGGDVAFCNLELEDGLFDGPKGKPQFEAYRRMRKLTGQDWAGSYPSTNVLWLLYLTELLGSEKPIPGATAGQKRALRDFKKRLAGYACCGEVIWDELFRGLLQVTE